MAIKHRYKRVRSACLLSACCLLPLAGCSKKPPPPPPEQVVFDLAKEFANDTKTAEDVKTAFDKLNDDERTRLFEMRSGPSYFALFMVMGKAEAASREVLATYLAKAERGDPIRAQIIGRDLFRQSIGQFRGGDEDKNERIQISAAILERFPEQINNLSDPHAGFLGEAFHDVILKIGKETAPSILAHLSQKVWDDFYAWVFNNPDKTIGQRLFRDAYERANADEQAVMRTRLLGHTYSNPNINDNALAMIKEAEDFGLQSNILSDFYALPAPNSLGTTFKGSLLMVLAKASAREFQTNSLDPTKAFASLRSYALGLKDLLKDGKKFNDAIHEKQPNESSSIIDIVKNSLGENRAPFANYFLATDKPADLLDAAKLDETIFSNRLLKELYDLVIGENEEETSELADANVDNERFIDALIVRKIDDQGYSASLLDSFLSQLSPAKAQDQVKPLAEGVVSPLELLADVGRQGDSPLKKAQMIARLLKDDESDAVGALSEEEIRALMSLRQETFVKFLYGKLSRHPELAQAARSELLRQALEAGPVQAQLFADKVAENRDPFGLRSGVAADLYTLKVGDKDVEGTLLMVFSKRAAELSGQDLKKSRTAFGELRGMAQSIKSALGEAYLGHITKDPDSVKAVVTESLEKLHRQDFANYYLADETVLDVYRATVSDLPSVSNAMVKELYDLIIYDAEKTAVLALQHKYFLHELLKRSPDKEGALKALLDRFLAGMGPEAELALITTKDRDGETPITIVLKSKPYDILLEKVQLFTRLSRHASPDALAEIAPGSIAKMTPLWLNDAPEFKRIHGLLLPKNGDAALAMRSVWLDALYQKPPWTVLSELKNLLSSRDPFGLADTALTYRLEQRTEKPLLMSLAEGAVEKYKTTDKLEPLVELRTYALAIKASLIDEKYRQMADPIKTYLDQQLDVKYANFTRSYLGIDEVGDVFAAANNVAVDNLSLKKLFARIVANKPEMAAGLADMSERSELFIHRLLKRPVDADGNLSSLLQEFLGLLGDEAKAQVLAQHEDEYPLQLLTKSGRNEDDPVQKIAIFSELIKPDTENKGILSLNLESLLAQNFFIAGAAGQEAFKAVTAIRPELALALRSALLRDAIAQRSLLGAKALVGGLDAWGLKSRVSTDEYELSGQKKNLLAVLTHYALEEADRNPKATVIRFPKSSAASPYDILREIAQALRVVVEEGAQNKKGAFVRFAQSATDALKDKLDPQNKGFAEYFLDLDNTAESLNAELLLAVFDNKASFSMGLVAWLYRAYAGDEAHSRARYLAGMKNASQERFIHLLAKKPVVPESKKVLGAFLSDIENPSQQAAQVALNDPSGRNAIQILLDPERREVEVELNQVLRLLLDKADAATLARIESPSDAERLLFAASKLKPPPTNAGPQDHAQYAQNLERMKRIIPKLFTSLPEASMAGVAKWSAQNISAPHAQLFKSAYEKHPGAQAAMRKALVDEAYEFGRIGTSKSAGISAVASLVKAGFFDKEALALDNFVDGSSLLLAMFKKEPLPKIADGLKELAAALKERLGEDWANYLEKTQSRLGPNQRSAWNEIGID